MTTHRTGNVAGFPLPAVWEGEAIVAVVVNGDQALAERICALLNADQDDLGAQLRDEAAGNPRHPTCLDVTGYAEMAEGRQVFICGSACPPPRGDAPSGSVSLPLSAEQAPVGGSGRSGGSETVSGDPTAEAEKVLAAAERAGAGGTPEARDLRESIAEMRSVRFARGGRIAPPSVGPGCICNDPPPTVDKPKNGTASRPPGWACPRHGAVI